MSNERRAESPLPPRGRTLRTRANEDLSPMRRNPGTLQPIPENPTQEEMSKSRVSFFSLPKLQRDASPYWIRIESSTHSSQTLASTSSSSSEVAPSESEAVASTEAISGPSIPLAPPIVPISDEAPKYTANWYFN